VIEFWRLVSTREEALMNSPPAPDRVRVVGPLAPFADGFLTYLVERGYSLRSAQFQLQFLAHVSRWLDVGGRDVSGLTADGVEEFLAERRRLGYATSLSPMGARQLLGFLDGLGLVPAAAEPVPAAVDSLLDAFCEYLLAERGLAAKTITGYARVARRFLEERSEPLEDTLASLSAARVHAFVLREARRVGRLEAGRVVCALRSLLRSMSVRRLSSTCVMVAARGSAASCS
jgi:integrase/recombinase XerD